MKKLVIGACALAAVSAMAVESANIVGYYERETTGAYAGFSAGFQKVGGGTTHLSDVIDTSLLGAYASDVMVYDNDDGTFTQWIWDGSAFTDWTDTTDPVLAPGTGYLSMIDADVQVSGEVVNPTTLTFDHVVPAGYSFIGSAFPVALLQSNCNFGTVLAPYGNDIQVYDPDDGSFTQWIWDGTGFTDWTDYLPDTIAQQGEAVLFGNMSGDDQTITEDINPKN